MFMEHSLFIVQLQKVFFRNFICILVMNISSYEKLLLESDYYGKNKVTQNVSSSENKLVIKKHFNQLLLWLDNYTKN